MPVAIVVLAMEERLRLRDAVSLPGLLSLTRAPLAVAFPFALGRPFVALTIVAAAALSDVLDGWLARRSGRATVTGAILDPVMDKVFVATVAVSLLVAGDLSFRDALLLGARDVLEVPLVLWVWLDLGALADRTGHVRANALGKIVTVLQFATVVAALSFAKEHVGALALASGTLGVLAAVTYWGRVLRGDLGHPAGKPS